MGIRNEVLLKLGYDSMRRRSEICNFRFEDVDYAPVSKPIIRLIFLKTDQFGTGKVFPISKESLELIDKWKILVDSEGYILPPINR